MQVAQLPEDPWDIVTYSDLLAKIACSIGITSVNRGVPAHTAEATLRAAAAEHGVIVVLVENLDLILGAIGGSGQQSLRHFLQDSDALLMLATTPAMDRALSDQSSPFYGFFTTMSLPPLTVEQAQQLLINLSLLQGQDALADALRNRRIMARIRGIAPLTGGQPRIWVSLSAALDMTTVDDMATALLNAFDGLTPYYQDQLRGLSPQQRALVAEFARADHALHVAEVAQRTAIDQRTASKALGELTTRGWVQPVQVPFPDLVDRRRTYFELTEPLAKLAFQTKESRGEPLPAVVDILTAWLDPGWWRDASHARQRNGSYESLVWAAAQYAVGLSRLFDDTIPGVSVRSLSLLGTVDDALAALADGDPDPFLALPTPLRMAVGSDPEMNSPTTRGRAVLVSRVALHVLAWTTAGGTRHGSGAEPRTGRMDPALLNDWIGRAESLTALAPVGSLVLADWLRLAGRDQEADAVERVLAPETKKGRLPA